MLKKRLKDKYNDTFEVVKKIINEWDPLNLLALDCPDDEYESEIQLIVSATLNENNTEKLAEKINEILYKSFEEDFKKSNDCFQTADKILTTLNKS
jgi:hypothetical protein